MVYFHTTEILNVTICGQTAIFHKWSQPSWGGFPVFDIFDPKNWPKKINGFLQLFLKNQLSESLIFHVCQYIDGWMDRWIDEWIDG